MTTAPTMNEQTTLLAIDPGPVRSAAVWLDGDVRIVRAESFENEALLDALRYGVGNPDHLAIEMIASYGMPVGREVFETCVWIGRFIERFANVERQPRPHTLVYRKDVKMNLCGSMRAKDGNIRAAIIDRLGPQGTKKEPGATYGISRDLWSALAVGLTWMDKQDA